MTTAAEAALAVDKAYNDAADPLRRAHAEGKCIHMRPLTGSCPECALEQAQRDVAAITSDSRARVAAAREFYAQQTKDTNPKDAIGVTKLPLHLVPATAVALASLAHLDGALKYGTHNWRIAGVRASIYIAAAKRHLDKWFNGEDCDKDSGLPHLAHALACINIIVDAAAAGKLNDDRAPRVDIGGYIDSLTQHVKRLTDLHADKKPRHYTIADSEVVK